MDGKSYDLWDVAARQHWLVTTAQLRAAGLTPQAIRHRVECGRLHPVRRAVYAVGHPADRADQRVLAAALAVGPQALVSGRSAGALFGTLETAPRTIEVSVPSQSGRTYRRRGLTVHRCATLTSADRETVRLIPVTSLRRTLRDLAGVLSPGELRSALRQSERIYRLDLGSLRGAVRGPLSGSREARLRRLIDDYVPATLNRGLEEAFFEALVRWRVAPPETQQWLADYRVDFLWRAERLVVETDDRAGHAGWTARANDVIRDRRLAARGYETLRFTWTEIAEEPSVVAEEIGAALIRRRAQLVAV